MLLDIPDHQTFTQGGGGLVKDIFDYLSQTFGGRALAPIFSSAIFLGLWFTPAHATPLSEFVVRPKTRICVGSVELTADRGRYFGSDARTRLADDVVIAIGEALGARGVAIDIFPGAARQRYSSWADCVAGKGDIRIELKLPTVTAQGGELVIVLLQGTNRHQVSKFVPAPAPQSHDGVRIPPEIPMAAALRLSLRAEVKRIGDQITISP